MKCPPWCGSRKRRKLRCERCGVKKKSVKIRWRLDKGIKVLCKKCFEHKGVW